MERIATVDQIRDFECVLRCKNIPDFLIMIDGHQWRVHSDLVARQSKFFEKACNGPFMEFQQREVTLHDDCPLIVARMVQFFYYGYYYSDFDYRDSFGWPGIFDSMFERAKERLDIFEDLETTDLYRSRCEIHALLYQLADKYEITSLKVEINKRLQMDCTHERDFFQITEIIGIPALHRDKELLRSITTGLCASYMGNPETYPRFKELLDGDVTICLAMMDSMMARYSQLKAAVDESEKKKTQIDGASKKKRKHAT